MGPSREWFFTLIICAYFATGKTSARACLHVSERLLARVQNRSQ